MTDMSMKKNPHISFVVDQREEEKSKYPKQKMMTDRPIGVWPGHIHKYVHTSIYFDVCVGVCLFVCVPFVFY